MATLMSRDIYDKVGNVEEVNVQLLSMIGSPIHQPQATVIELGAESGITRTLGKQAREIVNDWLSNIDKVTDLVLNQQVGVC